MDGYLGVISELGCFGVEEVVLGGELLVLLDGLEGLAGGEVDLEHFEEDDDGFHLVLAGGL